MLKLPCVKHNSIKIDPNNVIENNKASFNSKKKEIKSKFLSRRINNSKINHVDDIKIEANSPLDKSEKDKLEQDKIIRIGDYNVVLKTSRKPCKRRYYNQKSPSFKLCARAVSRTKHRQRLDKNRSESFPFLLPRVSRRKWDKDGKSVVVRDITEDGLKKLHVDDIEITEDLTKFRKKLKKVSSETLQHILFSLKTETDISKITHNKFSVHFTKNIFRRTPKVSKKLNFDNSSIFKQRFEALRENKANIEDKPNKTSEKLKEELFKDLSIENVESDLRIGEKESNLIDAFKSLIFRRKVKDEERGLTDKSCKVDETPTSGKLLDMSDEKVVQVIKYDTSYNERDFNDYDKEVREDKAQPVINENGVNKEMLQRNIDCVVTRCATEDVGIIRQINDDALNGFENKRNSQVPETKLDEITRHESTDKNERSKDLSLKTTTSIHGDRDPTLHSNQNETNKQTNNLKKVDDILENKTSERVKTKKKILPKDSIDVYKKRKLMQKTLYDTRPCKREPTLNSKVNFGSRYKIRKEPKIFIPHNVDSREWKGVRSAKTHPSFIPIELSNLSKHDKVKYGNCIDSKDVSIHRVNKINDNEVITPGVNKISDAAVTNAARDIKENKGSVEELEDTNETVHSILNEFNDDEYIALLSDDDSQETIRKENEKSSVVNINSLKFDKTQLKKHFHIKTAEVNNLNEVNNFNLKIFDDDGRILFERRNDEEIFNTREVNEETSEENRYNRLKLESENKSSDSNVVVIHLNLKSVQNNEDTTKAYRQLNERILVMKESKSVEDKGVNIKIVIKKTKNEPDFTRQNINHTVSTEQTENIYTVQNKTKAIERNSEFWTKKHENFINKSDKVNKNSNANKIVKIDFSKSGKRFQVLKSHSSIKNTRDYKAHIEKVNEKIEDSKNVFTKNNNRPIINSKNKTKTPINTEDKLNNDKSIATSFELSRNQIDFDSPKDEFYSSEEVLTEFNDGVRSAVAKKLNIMKNVAFYPCKMRKNEQMSSYDDNSIYSSDFDETCESG